MTTKTDWQDQVGRTWADNYRSTDRAFSELTPRLLERIAARSGDAIADIGCGAGELSLALAAARPHARVVGVDVSPELLDVARQRGAKLDQVNQVYNVRFTLADAAQWAPDGFAPDLYVSRHGVMFFPDPVAAFGHLRGIAAASAQLVFTCFRAASENAWAADVSRLLGLPPPADPFAPGPFAFADRQRVADILGRAGWTEVAFEPVDFAYVAGRGADPVAAANEFFRNIGPSARALRELTGEARARAETIIERWVSEHRSGDRVAFASAAWIVSARRG